MNSELQMKALPTTKGLCDRLLALCGLEADLAGEGRYRFVTTSLGEEIPVAPLAARFIWICAGSHRVLERQADV